MQHLSKLTPSHNCGHDNLSAITLKSIANEICKCITLIINQSITTGIFPDQLKVAKVVPIFKKNDQSDIKNYRPISVLPTTCTHQLGPRYEGQLMSDGGA